MDTPQSKSSINYLINSSSSSNSNSPIVQDSPVFNYISNLSPIQPVKAEPGAQGFPGLASPPLLFTSPRINSLQSLLNRKLQASGSLEFPQDSDICHQNDVDPRKLDKEGPVCDKEIRTCVKNLGQVARCSPGDIDDFLSDPDGNSSCKQQSNDASQSSGSYLQKRGGGGEKVDLHGSTSLKLKKGAQARSRISIKVVKNEMRNSILSSECVGSLPRLSTEHAFEVCHNGDSLNEASHFERGTLRRCLFEEKQKKCAEASEFRNISDNLARMEELIDASSNEPPCNSKLINRPKPVTISKPLGIGLHLNSVVYPRSLDNSNGRQLLSLAGSEGKNSVFTSTKSDEEVKPTIVGEVPAISEERLQNNACSIATSGEAKPSDLEHFHSPVLLEPDAGTAVTGLKRKISPQTTENDEVSYKMSPNKKRKKFSSASDDDIPKRCNCKKTKCLKLYCDCFAAGLYCSESCACQGCCNRPENEEIVIETRQQIESRNPLAFAPKIVKRVTDSLAINKEVQKLATPSSARHKTGCNCKKSMCMKKYCECYQSNVGCSDGCRCEGCKNVFGAREEYRIIRGFVVGKAGDEMSEAIVDRRQENTSIGSNFGSSRVHISSNLTPATPALQCSDLKKNALKSRLPLMRYLQSPDSQNDVLSSDENFLTCPENSQSIDCMDDGALHVEIGSENVDNTLESAGNESTSTSPLISNSVATLMVPPPSSKTNNSRDTSQSQLCDESVVPPLRSSLRWRSSPLTPISQSVGLEFQDIGSGSKNSDIEEDYTPDVLKDSSAPAKAVKVSSPNKKRISAPHNPIGDSSGSLINNSPFQNPEDSSGSLKVCHRFVLRALPSFPSLTPFSKKQ